MRRFIILSIIILSIIALLLFAGTAFAKDVILKDVPIESITAGVDKNGNPYIRIIITEMRVIEGIEYSSGTAVMAFRGHVEAASKLQDGGTLSAIATERFWNGRKSYTILKLLE